MLWTIIAVSILEWFTTLAVQMIALREAAPIVWSSVILTSIYLWVVLLALSIGYYLGGRIAATLSNHKIRLFLWSLLLWSALYYALITFWGHTHLLELLLDITGAYTFSLFVTAVVLFIVPMGMAAQTLPLLTQLIPEQSKWKSAWLILFFSTIGSFLWSIITTIVLFQYVWVATTSVITVAILWICSALLFSIWEEHDTTDDGNDPFGPRRQSLWAFTITLLVVIWMMIFGDRVSPFTLFKTDSAYQTIEVQEYEDRDWEYGDYRLFRTNNSFASWISIDTWESFFPYITEAVRVTRERCPQTVLVIGTAGFTYPQTIAELDCVEQIDAIDIDTKVIEAAEQFFLQEKINPKVNIVIESWRNTIRRALRTDMKYDLIFIDAYAGKYVPPELVTEEFFAWLRDIRSDRGTILVNMITDQRLESKFIWSVLSTFAAWLPEWEQPYVKNTSSSPDRDGLWNYILADRDLWSYRPFDWLRLSPQSTLYGDNKSSAALDLAELWIDNE